MTLSDQLAKLSSETKELEDSVASMRDRNHVRMKARLSDLHTSLDSTRFAIATKVDQDSAALSSAWADMQKSVSAGFSALRTKVDDHHAARVVDRAERNADYAELDAEDAVDFAIYAMQEAEYSVLVAAVAREDADAAAADPTASGSAEVTSDDGRATEGASAGATQAAAR